MSRSFRWTAALLAVAASLAGSTARAAILEDFQFGDANGTVITSAVNSTNAGNAWLSQNTAINAGVQSGSFRIQKGGEATPVPGQVSNSLEIANVSSGKLWLVADIAGWLYTSTPSATSERVRFAFLDNDPPAAGSSIVTAGVNIDRAANNNLTITGEAGGTGSTATIPGTADLALSRNTALRIVLEVDATADTYTILWKDGAAPYQSLPVSMLGERSVGVDREPRSVRFAFTGSFNDAGEFVDVNRIYVTDVNPIPEPSTAALAALVLAGVAGRRRRN
jgi:hypothetical protein